MAADVLDRAARDMAIGRKPGIDATIPPCGMPGESDKRGWPPLIKMEDTEQKRIDTLLRIASDQTRNFRMWPKGCGSEISQKTYGFAAHATG